MTPSDPAHDLRRQVADLEERLKAAEDTLRAITQGDIDAILLDTAEGPQLFTLASAQSAAQRFQVHALSQVTDAVVAYDNDRRITFFNHGAELLYGVPGISALGRVLEEIYQEEWLDRDDEPAAIAALA